MTTTHRETNARTAHRAATTELRIGVYGATGTTGAELVRTLANHDAARLVFGTSRSHRGGNLRDVDPAAPDVRLDDPRNVDPSAADFVFVCLPHGHSADVVDTVSSSGVPVVDLSGDLRLRDGDAHARVYGSSRSQSLAERAVYGLTETERDRISGASVVANPGCYPTCSALPLIPLVRRGLLDGRIVIDAKSGVSGAGRGATPLTHFCAAVDDVRPYKLGRAHRHVAEIEQAIDAHAMERQGRNEIVFCPHVVPIERGMLSTIVLDAPGVSAEDARRTYAEAYGDEPFIQVLPAGEAARIRTVVRTNRAAIGVSDVEGSGALVVTSAIDNLLKGAAGQAIQNMNVMMGFPESTGLEDPGMRASRWTGSKGATA